VDLYLKNELTVQNPIIKTISVDDSKHNYMQIRIVYVFLFIATNFFLGTISAQKKKESNKKPNILFIMSDDHASNAISIYGSRLSKVAPTPNIDRIANEGMVMKNVFVTNSICTPSRAAILTGQYSHINGVNTLKDDFNNKGNHLGKLMQNAGYTTAMIGKWHLHTEPTGFDYYNVLPGQGLYNNPKLKEKGKPWKDHKKGGEIYNGYVTDVITDQTLKWLDNRDTSKPFFLMSHHKAPHGLWEFAKRHEHLFDGIEIPEPASLYDDKNHGPLNGNKHGSSISDRNPKRSMLYQVTSKKWPTGMIDTLGMTKKEKIHATYQKYVKDYLRTVAAIDENVGRILDYLDANGLTENTIVVYTSDQGQFLGEHDYFDKRWMYEESLRMPFVIRYPKKIKPKQRNNDMLLNIDFAPTFLDFAGVKIPKEMQGRSFKSNLFGQTPDDWRTAMYYRYWMHLSAHYNPGHYGIRTENYKLIFFYGLPLGQKGASKEITAPYWEFYDLKKDPKEMNNLYQDHSYQQIIEQLKKELLLKKKKLKDTDKKYPELMDLRNKFW
jgi:arylsulfatase A-like enzyme